MADDVMNDILGSAPAPLGASADPIVAPNTTVPINADAKVSPPEDDLRYKAVFTNRNKMESYTEADTVVKQMLPPDTEPKKEDPHGIDLGDIVSQAGEYAAYDMNMAGRFAKDVGAGLTVHAPSAIYGGIADGWNETLKAADGALRWINDNVNGTGSIDPSKVPEQPKPEAGLMEKSLGLPTTEKADNVTAGLLRGISQFSMAFIPVGRGLKALGFGEKLASTLAAGAASAIAFEPAEKGLIDLIASVTDDQGKPYLEGPIAEFMITDPNDPEALNRLKNGIKGAAGGVIADYAAAGLGNMLKAIKQNRINNGISMQARESASAVISRDATLIGDRTKPFVDEATAGKIVDGTVTADDLVANLNFEKITDTKALDQLLHQIDTGRAGAATRTGTVAVDAKATLAEVLSAAAKKTREIASVASGSTDTAELYDFARMTKILSGVKRYAEGDMEGAARALKAGAAKFPKKGAKYLAALDSAIMEEGGAVQIRKVASIAKDMQSTPEAMVKAAKLARGSSWGNGIQAWWYFDLLSGTMTQAANVIGTVTNTLGAVPTRFLASGVSDAIGNGVAAGEVPAMLYGMVNSTRAAMKAFSKTWKTMTSEFDSNAVTEQRLFNMETNGLPISTKRYEIDPPDTALGKVWAKAIDGFGQLVASPTRALMATDEFFKTINNQMEMHALSYRKAVMDENLSGGDAWNRMKEIVTNPTEEMVQGSAEFAAKNTFNAPLDSSGNKISGLLNSYPWAKAVIPFHKIAINLSKWTLEHSPLGLLSSNLRKTIAAGGPEGDIALAKLAMGSMASMAVTDLAIQGHLTANGPRDPAQRANWLLTHQPWSIRHEDENGNVTWTPYNRVSPHGILMGMAASLGETYHLMKDEDTDKMAAAMAMATSRAFLNSTFMKGLADLFEAVDSRSVEGFQKYVNEQVATFIAPGILNSARQIADPVWRDAVTWNDAIANRIPGFLNTIVGVEGSDSLPPVQNLWGDSIETPGNALERAINPVVSKDMADDPVNNFIVDNQVRLDKPSKTQKDIELTPHEYADFVKAAGAPAKAELDRLFAGSHPSSATFKRLTDGPDGGKALMISRIVQAHRDVAAANLMKNPDFVSRYKSNVQSKAEALSGRSQTGGVRFGP